MDIGLLIGMFFYLTWRFKKWQRKKQRRKQLRRKSKHLRVSNSHKAISASALVALLFA
jgi:hypothetical protein